jgi:hypothetical protein
MREVQAANANGGKAMTDVTRILEGNRWTFWRIVMWGSAAILLALPAIAMRVHADGVQWSASDFIVMGGLLGAACALCELAARASSNGAYRLATAIAVGTAFLTVWANLAVGMIGNEDNPYNLLFGAVLFVALAGSILARFKPRGMARAMVVTSAAQAILGIAGMAQDLRGGMLSSACAFPWLLSAALYGKSSSD